MNKKVEAKFIMWRNILIYIFINSVLFFVNKIVYYFILEEWNDHKW